MNLNPAGLARFADWAQTLPPRPLPRTVTPVPAAVVLGPGRRKPHQQERLAAAASRSPARIARLYWDDPGGYLRDPDGFSRMLRPACRRCTARRGITGPVACRLPPHLTVCRRHRLWIGPSARAHAAQLDVSPFPEVLLAQLHHHPRQQVEAATSDATRSSSPYPSPA